MRDPGNEVENTVLNMNDIIINSWCHVIFIIYRTKLVINKLANFTLKWKQLGFYSFFHEFHLNLAYVNYYYCV